MSAVRQTFSPAMFPSVHQQLNEGLSELKTLLERIEYYETLGFRLNQQVLTSFRKKIGALENSVKSLNKEKSTIAIDDTVQPIYDRISVASKEMKVVRNKLTTLLDALKEDYLFVVNDRYKLQQRALSRRGN